LIDAVIGLEALLLADLQAELAFRFSLNYSTLSDTPENRHRDFLVAKQLYGLRSTIAHGTVPTRKRRGAGKESVSVPEAATVATEALRRVIRHFLPQTGNAPYRNHQFWERAYFGLPLAGSA